MKDFVPYQEALELKQLGFDEPCFAFYNYNSQLCRYMNPDKDWNSLNHQQLKNSKITLPDTHTAPTYSQAFRWFREKYDLHNGIYPYYDEYEFQIKDFRLPTNTPINGGLMKYEEAELECLQKLIKIVKEQQK
jgi:hypothetical protein